MAEASGLMRGKRGLVFGVANNRSLAWGIARACRAQGAEVGLYLSGRRGAEARRAAGRRDRRGAVRPLRRQRACDHRRGVRGGAEGMGHRSTSWCTPSRFPTRTSWTGATSTPRSDNFVRTMLISCYSFTALAQRAEKLMTERRLAAHASATTAREKWIPHYNVMGVAKAALESSVRYLAADLGTKNIRVNAISSGPIKTLAASGVGGLPLHPGLDRAQCAVAAQHDH